MRLPICFRQADSTDLAAMRLQTYFIAFAVNVKRIVKLVSDHPMKAPPDVRALFIAAFRDGFFFSLRSRTGLMIIREEGTHANTGRR